MENKFYAQQILWKNTIGGLQDNELNNRGSAV